MTALEAVLLTIITASTPLLLAAVGELVVERSGVLNLGVEGMMVMGAVCSFAAAYTTGSAAVGIAAGLGAGVAMSLVFGFLTQTLVTNQVATGLALTLFGLGLSGLIGEAFTGLPGGEARCHPHSRAERRAVSRSGGSSAMTCSCTRPSRSRSWSRGCWPAPGSDSWSGPPEATTTPRTPSDTT